MRCAAVAVSILLAALPALAATSVYRCGAEGRSFSDRPCPTGSVQARQPVRADTPNEADRLQAQETAEAEQRLARALRAERQAREAIVPPVVVMRTRALGAQAPAETAHPVATPAPRKPRRSRALRSPAV